ncbi:L-seryl-tRNA(Sec) selenium transferase [Marinobacter daqiaonensis]|uniref:L-seryl-tRNA(Sec) selenium transferase n=1 Tax=Marinobacter daqiaonensis TaxID=650891 RepID=A0A1I6HR69_9GAMM|nr:L-seryl-tRNA(Sec) selenium transferase [Marinobacter daqiaonensis]SFR56935.1 L-seryl-tRNA(Sec) selenium transferase [Marinobacter daqiaonensis]
MNLPEVFPDRATSLRPPSVDRILAWPVLSRLSAIHGRSLVLDSVRAGLEQWREVDAPFDATAFTEGVEQRVLAMVAPSIRPVYNLTGTVLHTNLGRAPLPREAIEAMVAVAAGATNLEFDLDKGKRGDRDDHVEAWVCRHTGAEAATVVNNNAAAVLLTLNSLALRREVVVSRGELIEIGGAFRLPDIMARAGCKLREVGTTNRTHPGDFGEAVSSKTAALMKAYTSNYRIEGFTAEVEEPALADIAREYGLPLVVDLGSGSLIDMTALGLPREPTVRETLEKGADVVTFSGDKLLGGPQAGIIAGRADLIRRIRKNPLKRALRCDKQTLAALEAVLRLYSNPDSVAERVPALRLLTRPESAIHQTAGDIAGPLALWVGADWEVAVTPAKSQIGSGSLPLDLLASAAVRLTPLTGNKRQRGRQLKALSARLRRLPVPVVGRISEDALLLDCRCLEDSAPFIAQLDVAESEP